MKEKAPAAAWGADEETAPACPAAKGAVETTAPTRPSSSAPFPIELQGPIGAGFGPGGWTAARLSALLQEAGGRRVRLVVTSPGGDLVEGLMMRRLLMAHKGGAEGFVPVMAASAATLVLCGCERVAVSRAALLLAHPCSMDIAFMGTANEAGVTRLMERLAATRSDLQAADACAAQVYAIKSGRPAEECLALMKKSQWLTGERWAEEGLADSLEEDAPAREAASAASPADGAVEPTAPTKRRGAAHEAPEEEEDTENAPDNMNRQENDSSADKAQALTLLDKLRALFAPRSEAAKDAAAKDEAADARKVGAVGPTAPSPQASEAQAGQAAQAAKGADEPSAPTQRQPAAQNERADETSAPAREAAQAPSSADLSALSALRAEVAALRQEVAALKAAASALASREPAEESPAIEDEARAEAEASGRALVALMAERFRAAG